MSNLVKITKDNDIAIITIDNPPVNALSPGVPEGIGAAIDEMNRDSSVRAAVVIGAGRTFVAGADIKEFIKMTSSGARRATLLPLLLHIEDSGKPVVMAIHGNAFGGGLELAMAGHYRLASSTAQVGQPEVKLGIIPGAGGTQRLPRLVGVAKAVEMCAEGKPISAREAADLGLVDRLIEGDLLAGAVAFAREIAVQPTPKTRERTKKLGAAEGGAAIFAAARESVQKKQRGFKAPLAAIDAVEAATKLPFVEGCQAEGKLFAECLFSDQSKALIHVFFGEREVAKIPDIPKETPAIPVNRVAIVGSGTMGGGIAMAFVNAGTDTMLLAVGFCMIFFVQLAGNSMQIFASEVFPTNARATGFGIAQGAGRLGAAFIIPAILWIKTGYGVDAVFVSIAVVLVIAAATVNMIGPEARGLSLDALAPPEG